MKSRAIIPLAIGLVIGVVAIKYSVKLIRQARGAGADTVGVLVASADISATSEITPAMLDVKNMPKMVLPKMYMADRKEVEGRVASAMIPAGQPIVQTMLAPKGTLPGLAVRIKEGMRAVAVQVDESAGVAGWVKPGSHVDVVAVMSGRSNGEVISKVILQNVEVLAVGQDSGAKAETGASIVKTVTLGVSPDNVTQLHLAATKGKIRLAMRNQSDDETAKKVEETTDNELLGIPAKAEKSNAAGGFLQFLSKLPKPSPRATDKESRATRASLAEKEVKPEPPAPKLHRVEVIEGSRLSEVVFAGEGTNLTRVSTGKGHGSSDPLSRPQAGPARP
jgi:pilus assembly protein CpaB